MIYQSGHAHWTSPDIKVCPNVQLGEDVFGGVAVINNSNELPTLKRQNNRFWL
jgi:hypothetical protein